MSNTQRTAAEVANQSTSFALREYYITTDSKNLPRLYTGGQWLYDGCTTEDDAERVAFKSLCSQAAALNIHVTCGNAVRDLELEQQTKRQWRERNVLGISNTLPEHVRQEYRPLSGCWDFH